MAGPPRELVRIDCGSGHAERTGRWVVPRRIEVRVRSGSARLDFTQAIINQPSVEIEAEVRSGALVLITKPGITVDLNDVALRSGSVKDRTQWSPDAPVLLHVRVSGQVGSGHLTVRPPRPPRRTFWQWLLRRPRPRLRLHGVTRDGVFVPGQAGAGDVGQVQQAVPDRERVGQHRVGPVLPLQPVPGRGHAE